MARPKGKGMRAGFSLMGLIVLLAVVAIMAAVITPMVFRQLMAARERATVAELDQINRGLNAFFADTGRYPAKAEGLAALVSDPGVGGWQGPYVEYAQEEPVAQVTRDAWNLAYAYGLSPLTTPVDTAEVLVVRGGGNRVVDSGTVGGSWQVRTPGDDLMALVTARRVNLGNVSRATAEMERLGQAAQDWFRDHGAYPTTPDALAGDYLDVGVGADLLNDPWQRPYVFAADNAAVPPTLLVTSWGPDGATGGGDDVVANLNSVIPGRRVSYDELAVCQAVVDANTNQPLSGNWLVDRVDFNLSPVLGHDGWGQPYEEQMSTRTVLSAGPDADYFTPGDNIPPGVVPDDVAQGGIQFVAGSAQTTGGNCDKIKFNVTNVTANSIVITNMIVTWGSPVAYYKEIKISGKKVVKKKKPQLGSGQLAVFKKSYTLQPGATVKVEIKGFKSQPNGGNKVNMGNTDMTVEFSDESVMTFNTGPC